MSLCSGTFSIRAATVAGPGNSILPAPPKDLRRSSGMSTMASSLCCISFSFLSLFALTGSNKDFITAQGILDAFRDAELCAKALDESLSGARSFDNAMAEYQRLRDEQGGAMYDFTCELATLEPPPSELQQLLQAVHGNQAAMDGFARLNAGTISPAEFFAPEKIGVIFAAAASKTHSVAATAESTPSSQRA
jgi:hypothetical protein